MLLLLCFFFWFLYSVCIFQFFFLSVRKKNVTLCYMNVCILIYLWFAKMKIWSMLQVFSPENEKKKKNEGQPMYSICVWWGRVVHLGEFQGLKKRRRMTKGVFLSSGVKSRVFTRSLVYYPIPSMMSLQSLPWIWLKAATIWTSSSPSHRSRISMVSLCFKSHE